MYMLDIFQSNNLVKKLYIKNFDALQTKNQVKRYTICKLHCQQKI